MMYHESMKIARRSAQVALALILLIVLLCLPAEARQLGCQYDAFGTSEDLVTFTDETSAFERDVVLAALDTTSYDLERLVEVMGRPLTVSVNGFGNFAGSFFVVVADFQSVADTQVLLMHEIGHVHDVWLLSDAERQTWSWLHPGIVLDTYITYGWAAPQADYFNRPIENFAFEFSRLHRPCSSRG